MNEFYKVRYVNFLPFEEKNVKLYSFLSTQKSLAVIAPCNYH